MSSDAPHPSRELTLRLETMTYGGEALGRWNGQAVFVNGGLPGETVRVRVADNRRRFSRAQVIDVIEPSPDRIVPRCRHSGQCGGCHWQYMTYEAQLRYKTAIVREQLQRLGGVSQPPVRDTIPSPAVWAYRNHAQFHIAPDGRHGFQAARSTRVVTLDEFHIIALPLQAWLHTQELLAPADRRLSVRYSSQTGRTELPDGSSSAMMFMIKGVPLRVSADSFFQVNTSLIETLIDRVLEYLRL